MAVNIADLKALREQLGTGMSDTKAALEEAGHPVSYYENIEGGHGGAADNSQAAFRAALIYRYLWRTIGG